MNAHWGPPLIVSLLGLAGCASPDRVAFVTDSEIGIGADSTVGNVNIGYDRNELVVGPAYPETGALPPVYAKLDSDLAIFNPRIQQLYATGEAARLVTDPKRPELAELPLHGDRKIMVFGTATNFGLKVHFVGQQPTSFNFGYKRKEFSVLPLRPEATEENPDHYASVLAGVALRVRTTSLTDTGVKASQFIATGDAADNLARRPEIQNLYGNEAQESLALAAIKGVSLVDGSLQEQAKPICDKYLTKTGDPALAAQFQEIEQEVGYSVGEVCIDPTFDRLTAIRTRMHARGLI